MTALELIELAGGALPQKAVPLSRAETEEMMKRVPVVPKHGIIAKGVSLGRAVVSQVVQGPVPDAVYQERMWLCSGCPMMQREGDKLLCGACGCGDWKLAGLAVKLKMPDVRCPLEPPKWQAYRG